MTTRTQITRAIVKNYKSVKEPRATGNTAWREIKTNLGDGASTLRTAAQFKAASHMWQQHLISSLIPVPGGPNPFKARHTLLGGKQVDTGSWHRKGRKTRTVEPGWTLRSWLQGKVCCLFHLFEPLHRWKDTTSLAISTIMPLMEIDCLSIPQSPWFHLWVSLAEHKGGNPPIGLPSAMEIRIKSW